MKALKSTKSVDYTSNNNLAKKSDLLSNKQNLIAKLKIINLLEKRKTKKNFNLSSDRSSDKLEILNTQENLKSKTPKNFTQNYLSSCSGNITNNFINNYSNLNDLNRKEFNKSKNLLSENNNKNNNWPIYNANSSCDDNKNKNNFDLKIVKKNSNKNSLNFNINNNMSNGNSSKIGIETEVNDLNYTNKNNNTTTNNINFSSFTIQKNVLTKNINSYNNNNSNSNIINKDNNNNFSHNVNNRKFLHKKGKSNLNGNCNQNFNLFVKPKICVNIINNNNNNNAVIYSNNLNENSKLIISSRRKNTKSASTDRKFSNSIDYTNSNHIKNNLKRTNIAKTKKTNELTNDNFILNPKANKSENEIKTMIQNELSNSLVKGSTIACPMSPQTHKSNLLNKYLNTDENSFQRNSGFIYYSSDKLLNQNMNIEVSNDINNNINNLDIAVTNTADYNNGFNFSNKKSENFDNAKSFNQAKDAAAQNRNPKAQMIQRTYSQLAKGIVSPKGKNVLKENQNDFSNPSFTNNNYNYNINNNHYCNIIANYDSDKNLHYKDNLKTNNNNNNNNNKNHNIKDKEKNSHPINNSNNNINNNNNNNKYYKINYNTRNNKTSKTQNIYSATAKKPESLLAVAAAVDENYLKIKNSKNKISINYLSKPNLRINSACNLNINLNNFKFAGCTQQKAKIKQNNYLSKISKALQMRQSPKEIDKKNFQFDYLVSAKPQVYENEFTKHVEKNKFNKISKNNNEQDYIKDNCYFKKQKQIFLSRNLVDENNDNNNLDFTTQRNFNNERFYNEIKTATSLENLNLEEDYNNININNYDEEAGNFSPIHLHSKTEKDLDYNYNNNCQPYEFDENNCNSCENIDDKIYEKNKNNNFSSCEEENDNDDDDDVVNINNKNSNSKDFDYISKHNKNTNENEKKDLLIFNKNKNTKKQTFENKFEENLNYLNPDSRIQKETKISNKSNEAKANQNQTDNCAIIKCLETTLSSFDILNLDKEENFDLNKINKNNNPETVIEKGVYEKERKINLDFESEEKIKNNLVFKREEANSALSRNADEALKSGVVNSYNRRINSNIFPKSQNKNEENGFSQTNKFFEKFILEKNVDAVNKINKIENVNIYKRKKSINNNNSNNIPININNSSEAVAEKSKADLLNENNTNIINAFIDNNNNNINYKNSQSENINASSNKNLIKIETNYEHEISNEIKSQKNNNKKITKESFNLSEKNSNNLNKVPSGNAGDSISDFKKNFSPRNFNLKTNENPKQSENYISFDTNPSAFQSNQTPLSSNDIINNSIINNNFGFNIYKIRKNVKADCFNKTEEDNYNNNNFDCPEDLHFYYVKTLQKGKNFIVNFD